MIRYFVLCLPCEYRVCFERRERITLISRSHFIREEKKIDICENVPASFAKVHRDRRCKFRGELTINLERYTIPACDTTQNANVETLNVKVAIYSSLVITGDRILPWL